MNAQVKKTIECDNCDKLAVGEVTYYDGEILVGCADCLIKVITEPSKPVDSIHEYEDTDLLADYFDDMEEKEVNRMIEQAEK